MKRALIRAFIKWWNMNLSVVRFNPAIDTARKWSHRVTKDERGKIFVERQCSPVWLKYLLT